MLLGFVRNSGIPDVGYLNGENDDRPRDLIGKPFSEIFGCHFCDALWLLFGDVTFLSHETQVNKQLSDKGMKFVQTNSDGSKASDGAFRLYAPGLLCFIMNCRSPQTCI